jgi:hypothetical protein
MRGISVAVENWRDFVNQNITLETGIGPGTYIVDAIDDREKDNCAQK